MKTTGEIYQHMKGILEEHCGIDYDNESSKDYTILLTIAWVVLAIMCIMVML